MTAGEVNKNPPLIITLECQHDASFLAPVPQDGDVVYCRKCRDYREVGRVETEYHIRCDSCRMNRRYGRDLRQARSTASRHVLTRQTHKVSIMDGAGIVETVAGQGIEDELPFASILNERRSFVRKHQELLKSVTKSLPEKRLTEPPA